MRKKRPFHCYIQFNTPVIFFLFFLFIISFCYFSFQWQYIFLFSRQGKVRLQKWYNTYTQKEKKKIMRDLLTIILARKPKMCSFLEYKDYKVCYKRFVLFLLIVWKFVWKYRSLKIRTYCKSFYLQEITYICYKIYTEHVSLLTSRIYLPSKVWQSYDLCLDIVRNFQNTIECSVDPIYHTKVPACMTLVFRCY